MPVSKKTTDGLCRLNVLLQKYGVASRRSADVMIREGRVSVDDEVVTVLGSQVALQSKIAIDGKVVKKIPPKVTYLFHKPPNTLTSRKDSRGRPLIYDLKALKRLPPNVQAVGRLDFKTEGLLILTNDGELALSLTHPRYCIEKVYNVLVSTAVTQDVLEQLRKGVNLEDGLAKPIYARILSKQNLGASKGVWVEIIVGEGRNRLVRRMMEAVGLKVIRLIRTAIGSVRLSPSLAPGDVRTLYTAEKKYLTDVKENIMKEEHKTQKASQTYMKAGKNASLNKSVTKSKSKPKAPNKKNTAQNSKK